MHNTCSTFYPMEYQGKTVPHIFQKSLPNFTSCISYMKIETIQRTHMTEDPNLKLFNMGPEDQKGFNLKPKGFWYAIGDAWIEWCRGNMPEWESPYTYTFELCETSNILYLDTPDKVDNFTEEFSVESIPGICYTMNWERISRKYDGVEFNPYFYGKRFDHNRLWYNGIDVPSGVIFKINCIKNIERHEN